MLESKEEEEEEERIFKVSCKPHAQILTDEHIHRDAHMHTGALTDASPRIYRQTHTQTNTHTITV
jgi:hypothetical protein